MAVSEAVPRRCCVVTQLEGEVYQLVNLVSLLVIDRDGIIGKQCGLAKYEYTNTQIHKYRKIAIEDLSFY